MANELVDPHIDEASRVLEIPLGFAVFPQGSESRGHDDDGCQEKQPGENLPQRPGVPEPDVRVQQDENENAFESEEAGITMVAFIPDRHGPGADQKKDGSGRQDDPEGVHARSASEIGRPN